MTRLILALILMSVLAFDLLAPKQELVYDDAGVLELNETVKARDYTAIWTKPYWSGVKKSYEEESLFRPLFLTVATALQSHTHLLRLLSLGCYALLGLLLWLCLGSVGVTNPWLRNGATALFLYHPANVEVSAQIIGLMETAPALLGIGAILLADESPLLAVILAALSPALKEIGFVYLGALSLLFLRRKKYRWCALAGGIVAMWIAVRYLVTGALLKTKLPYVVSNPFVAFDFTDRFFSRLALVGHHLRLFFFPVGLTSDYSLGTLPLPGYPLQVWVLAGAAFLILLWKSRDSIPAVAWAALATILPTLHLGGPIEVVFAERFGLLFRFGLVLLLFSVARKSAASWPTSGKISGAASLVLCLGLFFHASLTRHRDWASAKTLFAKDSRAYPFNPRLHLNLGVAYGKSAEWTEARSELLKAVFLAPDFVEAHYRLGLVFRQLGDEAHAQYEWSIASQLGLPIPKRPAAEQRKEAGR